MEESKKTGTPGAKEEKGKAKERPIDIFAFPDSVLKRAKKSDEEGFLEQFGPARIDFVKSTSKDGRDFFNIYAFIRKGNIHFDLRKHTKDKNVAISQEDFLHYQIANRVGMEDGKGSIFIPHAFRVSKVNFIRKDTGERGTLFRFDCLICKYTIIDENGEEVEKYEVLSAVLRAEHRKLFNDYANLRPEDSKLHSGLIRYVLPIYLSKNEEVIDGNDDNEEENEVLDY